MNPGTAMLAGLALVAAYAAWSQNVSTGCISSSGRIDRVATSEEPHGGRCRGDNHEVRLGARPLYAGQGGGASHVVFRDSERVIRFGHEQQIARVGAMSVHLVCQTVETLDPGGLVHWKDFYPRVEVRDVESAEILYRSNEYPAGYFWRSIEKDTVQDAASDDDDVRDGEGFISFYDGYVGDNMNLFLRRSEDGCFFAVAMLIGGSDVDLAARKPVPVAAGRQFWDGRVELDVD